MAKVKKSVYPAGSMRILPQATGKGIPVNNAQRSITFAEILGQKIEKQSQAYEQQIDELLQQFTDCTEKFKQNQGPGELKEFRESVRRVLQYILDNGVSLRHVTGRQKTNQLVEYEIVRINRELELVSQAVLQGNKGLKLLAQIEKIKGILFTMVG